jgi:hypothetical protein
MKDGKQFYSVVSKEEEDYDNEEMFLHKVIAPVREEEIPICK